MEDKNARHIIDHTKTKGKVRYSICGERIYNTDWVFHDKAHARKTLASNSPIKVCSECFNKYQ